MSIFSELLAARIKQSDFTLPYLAEKSGVSLSLITKTKNGTRLPDEPTMHRLFSALCLSADQTDELLEQYHIERLGRYEYECDMECFKALENLGLSESDMASTFSLSGKYEFQYHSVANSMQDIRLLMLYLYDQSKKSGDTLKVIYPAQDTFLNNLIATVSQVSEDNDRHVNIEHVFRLYPSGQPRSTYKNLEIVSGTLYMLSLNPGYMPYYYYNEDSDKQIYPYLIMNGSYALLINSDLNGGLLINDEDMIESCSREFDKRKKASVPLVKQYFALNDYVSEIMRSFDNEKISEVCCLSDFPCIMPCVPEDMLISHIIPEIRNVPGIKEYIDKRSIILSYEIINICSADGIRKFIETGIAEEVPNGIHEPLSHKESLMVMKNYMELLDRNRVRLHLIKDPHIHFSDNFEVCSFDKEKTIIMWKYGRLLQQFDFLNEVSVAGAFRNFIEFFVKSPMVYSEKESKKILADMIEKYEKQYKSEK